MRRQDEELHQLEKSAAFDRAAKPDQRAVIWFLGHPPFSRMNGEKPLERFPGRPPFRGRTLERCTMPHPQVGYGCPHDFVAGLSVVGRTASNQRRAPGGC